MLTPHLDPVPESEFQALAPTGVSIHAARVLLGMIGPDGRIIARVGPDVARAFAEPPAVDDAAALLAAVAPSAIVYAFTSSSYIVGPQADATLQARLEARAGGIPVIVQSAALALALGALGARRIALMHPPWFSDHLDALGATYFREQGFDVVLHGPAKLGVDFGEVPPGLILDWATAHTPDDAEALAIGGGGLRAIGAIEALEQALGRPVVSANQATLWQALRVSGIEDQLVGYGRLFGIGLPAS